MGKKRSLAKSKLSVVRTKAGRKQWWRRLLSKSKRLGRKGAS